MEEKKEGKTVAMNTANKDNKQQKLTYEQLNDACNQLFQQNQYLAKQLRELNMANSFKRLDYLFKVVELASTFKDDEFVADCIDEIKEAMVLKEEPEDTDKKEE